jgi:lipopolysaccharide transport system ATP-binding protein
MTHSILVENVTKCYRLGEVGQARLGEALASALRKLTRREKPAGPEVKWALDGLSLKVERGEVIGLIGRNGAGKSTLLKVLSQITYPTSGNVKVRGRVGSLLEVGTGFHEDLTGRENIFLNGSILGMRKKEIDAAMEQIIEFADIGPFLDTPIKRYSSGMRMRLGFSVAAHLSTDVLFVDEVLAVGDVAFQKKCLGAMRDVAADGRTVVFVSHNMAAVESLCKRTVWIADGRIKQDGETRDVIRAYLNSFGATESNSRELGDIRQRTGTGAVRFQKIEFLGPDGREKKVVHSGDALTIRLHYECQRDIPNLGFGARIYTNLGTLVSEVNTWATGEELELAPKGPGVVDVEIDFMNLMPGSYFVGIWASSFYEWHDVLDNVAKLDVEPSDYYGTGRGIEARFGIIFLPCRWGAPGERAPGREGRNGHLEVARDAPGNGVARAARASSEGR